MPTKNKNYIENIKRIINKSKEEENGIKISE